MRQDLFCQPKRHQYVGTSPNTLFSFSLQILVCLPNTERSNCSWCKHNLDVFKRANCFFWTLWIWGARVQIPLLYTRECWRGGKLLTICVIETYTWHFSKTKIPKVSHNDRTAEPTTGGHFRKRIIIPFAEKQLHLNMHQGGLKADALHDPSPLHAEMYLPDAWNLWKKKKDEVFIPKRDIHHYEKVALPVTDSKKI